ncbi:MAG TPA: peptide chain release factor N(5)-glutamine methyltransferase [Candidatus Dormibacteraeota bacterium]|nr:peptide chain release factor N(5)-glutamine methyltransferase [Candidatus Dormibacteraeota bacterium]
MPTVEELLRDATVRLRDSGSTTPRLDAEVLLAAVLGVDRSRVIAHGDVQVPEGRVVAYGESVERRVAGEPVAYIRGIKEFHGLAFGVDRRALIPRPETELLVELAELAVAERLLDPARRSADVPVEVVDVGTGSGAVAVALAVSLRGRGMERHVRILATDESDDALALAAENVVAHAVADIVRLRRADLVPADEGPFDVVAANLPYVSSAAMGELPVATTFEPPGALDGGMDGLDVIRRLLDDLPAVLAPDGIALLEIGGDQADAAAAAVADRLPGWRSEVARDLGGLPRVVRIERDGGRLASDRPG